MPANKIVYFEFGYEMGTECTNKFKMESELGQSYEIVYRYDTGKCYSSVHKIADDGALIEAPEIVQDSIEGNSMFTSGKTGTSWRDCDTKW